MKKIILLIVGIIILVIVVVGVMFAKNICPPQGPWPMPPWCSAGFTKYEYEVNVSPEPLSQIKAVNMYDTWGRNYNMGMIETTQANIVSSFDRVAKLGAQEVYVHDFDRAVYEGDFDFKSTNYQLVDEVFFNDMRDESISKDDLQKLVTEAHRLGLKLGIKRNIAFVNIGKYILDGFTGDISGSVVEDYKEFNSAHTEQWVRDYFDKWQARLVEKGKMYQDVGVDIMNISPSFQEPTFAGHEELVNQLWKQLIIVLRQTFKGQIAVDFNIYGLVDGKNGLEDWNKYDYYKEADIVECKLYKVLGKYSDRLGRFDEKLKMNIEAMISDIDKRAGELGIKVSVFFAPSSYQDGIFDGPVEYLDIGNDHVKSLLKDYDQQSRAFDYFFAVVKNRQNITRINVANFAWDDALDPEVKPRISVSAGFRNKPAEQVIEAWYIKK